jgi:hypothetical protein
MLNDDRRCGICGLRVVPFADLRVDFGGERQLEPPFAGSLPPGFA